MIYGYLLDVLRNSNIKIPLRLSLGDHCHMLLTGSSGSGKTHALTFLLGMLLKSNPKITIYILDFKNSEDFAFLSGYKHYYSGDECLNGIREYYNAFIKARQQRNSEEQCILIFDEYPSFVNYLQGKDKRDKTKTANEVLSAIAEALMLGRGIGFYIWIVTQRADAKLFDSGSRDNFMLIIALGKLSKEQKAMILPSEDIPDRIYRRGEGLCLADGYPLLEIKFPLIDDVDDWKDHIRNILMPDGCAKR